MMKSHCDRCEKLVDTSRTWCEEGTIEEHKIYHVSINSHKQEQFCKECIITILNTYLKLL